MSQNYPNPFNPETKIDFRLSYDGKVKINLYDITGRKVSQIENEIKTAGTYSINFNASNLSSGVYFYELVFINGSENFSAVKRMLLIK